MTKAKQDQFLLLIKENKGIIYKIAKSYCKDEEDRKDLTQEIIIQLWRAYDKYDPSYKLSTWMYRIALNVSISFFRKSKKTANDISIDEEIIHLTDDPSSGELETNIHLLQQFISGLKELDRAIMLLYLEDRSYKDISEILGITETNVATKISRIKEKLKQKFSLINQY